MSVNWEMVICILVLAAAGIGVVVWSLLAAMIDDD